MTISVHLGDCVAWLRAYDGPLFDACVTDPPYHLSSIVKRFGGENAAPAKSGKTGAYARASKGFMGKTWDGGDVAFRPETWRAIYDKLKPGAHLVAFSGTRTYHRMVCAIEDAGFEIRDQLAWMFGSGFPKSHDVSKGIDKAAGDFQEPSGIRKLTGKARIKGGGGSGRGYEYGELREFIETFDKSASQLSAEWQGWGSALKPAFEPICLARKPLSEKTIAANVLKWGTGAINVDACRVNWQSEADAAAAAGRGFTNSRAQGKTVQSLSIGKESRGGKNTYNPDKLIGRWPANVIHDGGAEVLAGFPVTRAPSGGSVRSKPAMIYGGSATTVAPSDNGGSAARFFYSAKAGHLIALAPRTLPSSRLT